MTKDMEISSGNLNFEEAKLIRDQIEKLNYITQPQTPTDYFIQNPNLYVDIRNREMEDLRKIIGNWQMKAGKLHRIECYDVAHLAGASPTASMVTFIDGEADKSFYRHFRINQKKGNSDVDSLREVIRRRLNHLKDWGKPDLIIVDGGKPQVSAFVRELKKYEIPIAGIAKRLETLVVPVRAAGAPAFNALKLPVGPALNFIQRIRNEAHRFARRYHHHLISQEIAP